jgi:hypothetical protein
MKNCRRASVGLSRVQKTLNFFKEGMDQRWKRVACAGGNRFFVRDRHGLERKRVWENAPDLEDL